MYFQKFSRDEYIQHSTFASDILILLLLQKFKLTHLLVLYLLQKPCMRRGHITLRCPFDKQCFMNGVQYLISLRRCIYMMTVIIGGNLFKYNFTSFFPSWHLVFVVLYFNFYVCFNFLQFIGVTASHLARVRQLF